MAENGSNRKVYLRSRDGSTKTVIGGEMSNSLTVNGVIIDVSDKDSDWAENIVGQKSWTLSASFTRYNKATGEDRTLHRLPLCKVRSSPVALLYLVKVFQILRSWGEV